MTTHDPRAAVPRSLVFATDIDVLPLDRVVQRRRGYLVVRSPRNPTHFRGNLLLFDDPPGRGDAARWEARFDSEFADQPQVRHRTFEWDRVDGVLGCARDEFVARGYDLEDSFGLIAASGRLRPHARENRDVVVRALDPAPGADEHLWDAVVALQMAGRDPRHAEASHRAFTRRRLADLRALFADGRGAWYVAMYPDRGEPVASCGVVVTDDRGRFQTVDTAADHRRRGICSRLIVEAAGHAARCHGAEQFVIAADADYHAVGLYESLGFERTEHVYGTCQWPPQDDPP